MFKLMLFVMVAFNVIGVMAAEKGNGELKVVSSVDLTRYAGTLRLVEDRLPRANVFCRSADGGGDACTDTC